MRMSLQVQSKAEEYLQAYMEMLKDLAIQCIMQIIPLRDQLYIIEFQSLMILQLLLLIFAKANEDYYWLPSNVEGCDPQQNNPWKIDGAQPYCLNCNNIDINVPFMTAVNGLSRLKRSFSNLENHEWYHVQFEIAYRVPPKKKQANLIDSTWQPTHQYSEWCDMASNKINLTIVRYKGFKQHSKFSLELTIEHSSLQIFGMRKFIIKFGFRKKDRKIKTVVCQFLPILLECQSLQIDRILMSKCWDQNIGLSISASLETIQYCTKFQRLLSNNSCIPCEKPTQFLLGNKCVQRCPDDTVIDEKNVCIPIILGQTPNIVALTYTQGLQETGYQMNKFIQAFPKESFTLTQSLFMLGGPHIWMSGAIIYNTKLTQSDVTSVKIVFTFYFIDQWDNGRLIVTNLNEQDTTVFDKNYTQTSINSNFLGLMFGDHKETFQATVNVTKNEIKLKFSATPNSKNGSAGLSDLLIIENPKNITIAQISNSSNPVYDNSLQSDSSNTSVSPIQSNGSNVSVTQQTNETTSSSIQNMNFNDSNSIDRLPPEEISGLPSGLVDSANSSANSSITESSQDPPTTFSDSKIQNEAQNLNITPTSNNGQLPNMTTLEQNTTITSSSIQTSVKSVIREPAASKCFQNCQTCDNAQKCIRCATSIHRKIIIDYVLLNNNCTQCEDGHYWTEKGCKACHKQCARCKGQPNECLECTVGYQIVGTTCQSGSLAKVMASFDKAYQQVQKEGLKATMYATINNASSISRVIGVLAVLINSDQLISTTLFLSFRQPDLVFLLQRLFCSMIFSTSIPASQHDLNSTTLTVYGTNYTDKLIIINTFPKAKLIGLIPNNFVQIRTSLALILIYGLLSLLMQASKHNVCKTLQKYFIILGLLVFEGNFLLLSLSTLMSFTYQNDLLKVDISESCAFYVAIALTILYLLWNGYIAYLIRAYHKTIVRPNEIPPIIYAYLRKTDNSTIRNSMLSYINWQKKLAFSIIIITLHESPFESIMIMLVIQLAIAVNTLLNFSFINRTYGVLELCSQVLIVSFFCSQLDDYTRQSKEYDAYSLVFCLGIVCIDLVKIACSVGFNILLVRRRMQQAKPVGAKNQKKSGGVKNQEKQIEESPSSFVIENLPSKIEIKQNQIKNINLEYPDILNKEFEPMAYAEEPQLSMSHIHALNEMFLELNAFNYGQR